MSAAIDPAVLRATWPLDRLEEATAELARARGFGDGAVEREPVSVPPGEVDDFLRSAAPAVVPVPCDEGARVLLLLSGGRGSILVLDPALERRRLRSDVVRATLGKQALEGAFLLRLPMSAPRAALLREARIVPRLAALLALHAVEYALWMGAWWLVGKGALEGRFELGWLLAFGLAIFTSIPLAMQRTTWIGRLAIEAGTLLKRRLLAGALALDPETTKQEGVGRFLSRVLESEAVENLAVGGGLLALLASVELVLALILLAATSNALLAVALVAWIAVTIGVARRLARSRRGWTDARLDLTHDLVESMVGHRTRLAQEPPTRRHEEEDRALERYAELSSHYDAAARRLAVLPQGWIVLGLLALAPRFVAGNATPAELAVALGAILVGARAFAEFTAGLSDLLGAAIGWQRVASQFAAAESEPAPPVAPARAATEEGPSGEPVLAALDLRFRWRDRSEAVLRGASFSIARGDRVLLEGPSGSGKSTFCSLLSGQREPGSGLLLLRGLDLATLGPREWRRRVACAPQFHENHVYSGTLAFNLLLGRAWPPSDADLELAERLCTELGLAPLLSRMPSGLQQMVGETGWQLSHGERSRVYIARALLQEAEVVVLDESFAALDPTTLREVIACVERRAPALLVVAHP